MLGARFSVLGSRFSVLLSMQHILHIPSWYPDATDPVAGEFFRAQVLALGRTGMRVGVIAPHLRSLREAPQRWRRGDRRGVTYELDNGIPTYRYDGWFWLTLVPRWNAELWVQATLRLFRRYVRAHGMPDLIHAHCGLHAGMAALRIHKQYQLPYVISEHYSGFFQRTFTPWQVPWLRQAFRAAAGCAAVSPALQHAMGEVLGHEAIRACEWIPNLLAPLFAHAPLAAPPATGFCLLNIGQLIPLKGQAELLDAFARAFRGNAAAQLRIIGDGPLRPQLEHLAQTLGIAAQVTLLGKLTRDQVLAQLQNAHALVVASHYETFSVVVIEAHACGRPVVATRCGGPETLITPQNGLLVPNHDPPALAQALRQMYETWQQYDPPALRQHCIEHFGEQAVVTMIREWYQQARAAYQQPISRR